MTRTELFKLRTHRTPWVLFTILTAALLIAPTYYAIKPPADTASVTGTFLDVAGIMTLFLSAVFGGWMIGHEFRQGTLARVLGNDARRGRLIATKAAIGLAASTLAMSIAAGIGALASAASVASFGETIAWDGVFRATLSGGVFALITAAVAFGISILARSDTYAMLGALGLMIIGGPLLTQIPTIGKYTLSALTNDVTLWISGPVEPGELGVAILPATLGLAASIAVLIAAATLIFQRRDI